MAPCDACGNGDEATRHGNATPRPGGTLSRRGFLGGLGGAAALGGLPLGARVPGGAHAPGTSDYGAAVKVDYTRGQTVTAVIPNLRCTKWQAFRGTIAGSPSFPACRSQIEIAVDGDWRRLNTEMEGLHTQVVYGDYLREIGYALKRLGALEWQCYSEVS